MNRTCCVCGKRLADLSPNKNLCFAHDPRYPKYEYIPTTHCTSFTKELWDRDESLDGVYLMPGQERFNSVAFSRVLIYPNFE